MITQAPYRRSRIERFFSSIGYVSITIASIFCLYFFYLIFWPFAIIDVKDSMNLPVTHKRLTVSDHIGFQVDYCKYGEIQPRVVKELINDNNVILVSPLGQDAPQLRKGCGKTTLYHDIPDYTPTGKYRLYIFSTYRVNILRNIEVVLRTEEFEVIGPIAEKEIPTWQ